MADDCVFCKIIDGKLPCYKIYEDDNMLAFLDIAPVHKGHCLIIPRQHRVDFPDLPESDKKVRPPPNKKTANTFMDLSNDFNSPGMCPPSTIKPKYSTLMSESLSSSNWFASPSITKNLMETPPQIEMTPPSPVLFQS